MRVHPGLPWPLPDWIIGKAEILKPRDLLGQERECSGCGIEQARKLLA